jgi:ATP-dependent Clp protease ATP-binding subunit ClpA
MEWLAEKGYSRDFGAREISRLVSTKLKDFFVDEILFGRLSGGGRAVADVENDDVVISIPVSAAENAPPEQPLP